MQIILLERVEKLGQMGDVVTVKDGYARNYLLPQKKAMRANAANKELFASRRSEIEAQNLTSRTEAEAVAKKLAGKSVVLLRQAGDTGQLYGSVTTRDIAAELVSAAIEIKPTQVSLDRPIKEIGTHPVVLKLHPEVEIIITANVARSNEEAELQAGGPAVPEAENIFETHELAQAAEEALSDDAAAEEEAAAKADPKTEAGTDKDLKTDAPAADEVEAKEAAPESEEKAEEEKAGKEE